MIENDSLGDRIKAMEMIEAGRKMMPGAPVVARLDGRAFHTLTRGLRRPFDPDFSACMLETARELVNEFHAAVGYTQSDEITLAWGRPDLFDGRFQKFTSILAGYASSVFTREAMRRLPPKGVVACFDCRVWQVPTREEVVEVFQWREWDATKNSVSMAARAHYSHRELHKKGRKDMLDMLLAKGVQWNDYPTHFKRGVYVKRRVFERTLTEEERMRIPEANRPAPDHKFMRSAVEVVDLPPITRVEGAADMLLGK